MHAAILPLIFVSFAAFFKAVSDTLAHHFDTSVFKRWDANFWDQGISWQYKHYLPFTKYPVDGWHLSNSAMIIAFSFAIVLHHSVLPWYWEWLIAGTVFNLVFNVFYNRILRRAL